jgi:hypothetical protein
MFQIDTRYRTKTTSEKEILEIEETNQKLQYLHLQFFYYIGESS